jgi:hypothetical protein
MHFEGRGLTTRVSLSEIIIRFGPNSDDGKQGYIKFSMAITIFPL